jgi:hypothetical protein
MPQRTPTQHNNKKTLNQNYKYEIIQHVDCYPKSEYFLMVAIVIGQ